MKAGRFETKRRRSGGGSGDSGDSGGTGGGHGLGSLTGMPIVQHVFHFLDGPADVLRASTAGRCWHEMACADAVWRVKAVREGMVEKAGVFEVALPGSAVDEGGVEDGGAGSSRRTSTATSTLHDQEEKDELAGVGLAFYKQVYVLKVPIALLVPICLRSDQHLTHSR